MGYIKMAKRRFKDTTAVKAALADVYQQYETGEIDSEKAHRLTYILGVLLKCAAQLWQEQKLSVLDQRLQTIEEKLNI